MPVLVFFPYELQLILSADHLRRRLPRHQGQLNKHLRRQHHLPGRQRDSRRLAGPVLQSRSWTRPLKMSAADAEV
jgi:hypothetical protein